MKLINMLRIVGVLLTDANHSSFCNNPATWLYHLYFPNETLEI